MSPDKTKNNKYNADKRRIYILFFNACGFKEVSYLLLHNMFLLSTDCNHFSSIIVNGMLASELYLKFIKAYDDSITNPSSKAVFIKTHDINTLFNDLSNKRQKEIRLELKKFGCDTQTFYKFRMAAKRAYDNQGNNKGKNGDVVNWRYLLTDRKNAYKFDINTMVKLIEVLYNISHHIINTTESEIKIPSMSSPILDEISESIVDDSYDICYDDLHLET